MPILDTVVIEPDLDRVLLSWRVTLRCPRTFLFIDHVTVTDALQIPTGALAPVAGTAFDFRKPHPVGARVDSHEPQMAIARGYDHNFVLNKKTSGALEPAARMEDPDSGIVLELSTTEPGIQVYSTNNVKPGQFNAQGVEIRKRDGIALDESFMIGDRYRDIEAGHSAGCRTILIGDGYNEKFKSQPDATFAKTVAMTL